MLCELFHFNRPQNVIFTMNITQSLNFLKKGLWGQGIMCWSAQWSTMQSCARSLSWQTSV